MAPRVSLAGGIRLLLLVLLVEAIQPAPLLVEPGNNQTVHSTHPILGVHTRLIDEVEPWKIKYSLELAREMGATSIVEFFPWSYLEPDEGNYSWAQSDLIIEHASSEGLQVIARLGTVPHWARPDDSPLNYLTERHYGSFAAYAAAFASRYRGKIDHIIVGNEPNLRFEWGYLEATPADYVALLSTVYAAVKRANPDVVVLGAALAPTLEPAGSQWGTNDLEFLAGIYEAGGADWFDGLAAHSYGLTLPALDDPDPLRLNFRRLELLREVMVRNGDGGKEIYITEFGWNDNPRWTMAVQPAERIQYTLDAIDFAEQNWPWAALIDLWVLRYPAPIRSYADNFSLVTPEFVLKPIYHELRAFTGNQ